MSYVENPKTKGSGILTCIPQKEKCPYKCEDCFFQSGRSYLEPLDKNLPNMPTLKQSKNHIIRVNDGNDSSVDVDKVIKLTKKYQFKFYNTSFYHGKMFEKEPIVVTINPSKFTDDCFYKIFPIPKNLMFVRFRTNMWNLKLLNKAIKYYSAKEVPIILTFMAYYKTPINNKHKKYYIFRKRTSNNYWAITTGAWEQIMKKYKDNKWVYSCGKIEGEQGVTKCRFCGNCIREYFVTKERLRNMKGEK